MRNYIYLVCCALLLLAACGGGGGGTTTPTGETINGLVVPPAPDPAINAATLAGVDSNNNGVRDDIDRKLASDVGAAPSEYGAAVEHAKSLQAAIVGTTTSTALAHVAIVNCMDPASRNRASGITRATLDTAARRSAYAAAFAGVELSSESCK